MNKKTKKRIDLLNKRLQKLRAQLSGVKQQLDEPEEATRLEDEIAEVLREVEELKAG
jgi:DNA-binding FrmR family transcriptional regulator